MFTSDQYRLDKEKMHSSKRQTSNFPKNFLGKFHELKEIAQYITSWEHCAHLPLFFNVYSIEVGRITIARNDLTLMVKYIYYFG